MPLPYIQELSQVMEEGGAQMAKVHKKPPRFVACTAKPNGMQKHDMS